MSFRTVKLALVVVFFVSLACSTLFTHMRVLDNSLMTASKFMNGEVNDMISNSILKKYGVLLHKVPSHVGTDPYHINLAIKLRAEFIQAVSGMNEVTLVLYNSDGVVMFSVSGNAYDSFLDADPLSEELLASLKNGEATHEKISRGLYSTVFPMMSKTGEPVVFLRVTRSCDDIAGFFFSSNIMFLVQVIIAIIACGAMVIFAYRKNTILLNSQYNANLELQEQKDLAEKESISKSQFLANISHELRTPLNSIIGFSDIMRSEALGKLGNDKYREYTEDIRNAGVHLLSLINDILDFSKAEANKLTVEMTRCDLSKIIDSCCNMVLPKAKEADVELKRIMPEYHVVMMADSKRMRQVILNILSNAIKFTTAKGCIAVSLEEKDGCVIIEISDNGIGIAQQDIYKVMSVFGKVSDNDHARKQEGTGLGLPLSKKLVELMNGTFQIKSEPNLGTVVTMTFPQEIQDSNDGAF